MVVGPSLRLAIVTGTTYGSLGLFRVNVVSMGEVTVWTVTGRFGMLFLVP